MAHMEREAKLRHHEVHSLVIAPVKRNQSGYSILGVVSVKVVEGGEIIVAGDRGVNGSVKVITLVFHVLESLGKNAPLVGEQALHKVINLFVQGGKRFEILVHAPEPVVKRHRAKQASATGAAGDGLASPMQGTVVKIAVEEGQSVEAGDLIIVLEAMKMEQPLSAHKAGVIKNLKAVVGETVSSGTVLCDIIEA